MVKYWLNHCYWNRLALAALLFLFTPLAQTDEPETIGFSVQEKPVKQITICYQDREAAVYHWGAALDKPYIHPLWTPDGGIVTYDAPADHVHHRGLCVAWADISGEDFWAEVYSPAGRRGQIFTDRVESATASDGMAQLTEHNRWLRQSGEQLLSSIHRWSFHPPENNMQIIDVDIQLTAVAPEVIFGSDPGKPRPYHGLTWRIGPFENPRYFNAQGDEEGAACFEKPAAWMAVSGIERGRPILAAILDSPTNDCFPSQFAVYHQGMQFISSSPNQGKPKILKQGETWRLRYRVIAAGAPPAGGSWDLNALWKNYAKAMRAAEASK
ncbi:PmoA family protein [bacterium]|nr:PmoA family protein [bacterium]